MTTRESPVDAWLEEFSRWLLLREAKRAEILAEMRSHLEDAVAEEIRGGRPRLEAERLAVHRFGPPAQTANQLTITWRITEARREGRQLVAVTGIGSAALFSVVAVTIIRGRFPDAASGPVSLSLGMILVGLFLQLKAIHGTLDSMDSHALRAALLDRIKVNSGYRLVMTGAFIFQPTYFALQILTQSLGPGRAIESLGDLVHHVTAGGPTGYLGLTLLSLAMLWITRRNVRDWERPIKADLRDLEHTM